jgi:adenosylmethionine-8-amino-7-oxononanoate aminotransferase
MRRGNSVATDNSNKAVNLATVVRNAHSSVRNSAIRNSQLDVATPLCITREEVDDLMDRLDHTLSEWGSAMGI